MAVEIKVYQSLSASREGFLKLILSEYRDMVEKKELIWRLFVRDLGSRYKQSLVGWWWVLLLPLVAVGTFFILNQSGIINIGEIPVPYPIYGLVGISFWQVFTGGVSAATGSVVAAGSLIDKVSFPKGVLVMSALGQVLVEFGVRFLLVLLLFVLYGEFPSIWILLSPFLIIPLVIFTLGVGFITALLNVIIRDIQYVVGIVMNFLLFLTPIMYAAPKEGLLAKVNQFNIVFLLVAVPRDIIISGDFSHFGGYLIASFVAVLVLLLGWLVFNKAQLKIADVV